jgi:hypothetical protein
VFGRIAIQCSNSEGVFMSIPVPAEARDEVVALVRAIIAG